MILTKAINVSPGDMEAYVDQLQYLVERLLPWLKDDISSSGSSNHRTPSPDIAQEDILEFEFEPLNQSNWMKLRQLLR